MPSRKHYTVGESEPCKDPVPYGLQEPGFAGAVRFAPYQTTGCRAVCTYPGFVELNKLRYRAVCKNQGKPGPVRVRTPCGLQETGERGAVRSTPYRGRPAAVRFTKTSNLVKRLGCKFEL